jgi:(1->4)-alpha-D-glucan 1-alpha-D-glucosylmutase
MQIAHYGWLIGGRTQRLGARPRARLARQNPRTADFTNNLLRHALEELIACFPVYRTYIDAEAAISDDDRRDIEWALAHARSSDLERDQSVFDFLEQLLGGAMWQPRSGFSRQSALSCVMRLRFGVSLAAFHKANAQRAHSFPHVNLRTITCEPRARNVCCNAAQGPFQADWIQFGFVDG